MTIDEQAEAARKNLAAHINASTDFHLRWMRRGFRDAFEEMNLRHGYITFRRQVFYWPPYTSPFVWIS